MSKPSPVRSLSGIGFSQLIPWIVVPVLWRYGDMVEWYCKRVDVPLWAFWVVAFVVLVTNLVTQLMSWEYPVPVEYLDGKVVTYRVALFLIRRVEWRKVNGDWVSDDGVELNRFSDHTRVLEAFAQKHKEKAP